MEHPIQVLDRESQQQAKQPDISRGKMKKKRKMEIY